MRTGVETGVPPPSVAVTSHTSSPSRHLDAVAVPLDVALHADQALARVRAVNRHVDRLAVVRVLKHVPEPRRLRTIAEPLLSGRSLANPQLVAVQRRRPVIDDCVDPEVVVPWVRILLDRAFRRERPRERRRRRAGGRWAAAESGSAAAAECLSTSATAQIGPVASTTESAIQTSCPLTQQIFHQSPVRLRPTTVTSVPALSLVTTG